MKKTELEIAKKKLEWLSTKMELEASKYKDKHVLLTKYLIRRDGFSKQIDSEFDGITQGDLWRIGRMKFSYVMPRSMSLSFTDDKPTPYNVSPVVDFYPKDSEVIELDYEIRIKVWYEEM